MSTQFKSFFVLPVILLLYLGFALAFLPQQSLWMDEVTQLDGLKLTPVESSKWLMNGAGGYSFAGVSIDRMPPMSYWLGWVWSKFFGLHERTMRLFGVFCLLAAILIIFFAGLHTYGLPSAIAAALLLATSPNAINYSVEIRAYPLFIMLSSGVLYYFAAVLSAASQRSAAASYGKFILFAVLAIYTHYFGILMTGSAIISIILLKKETQLDWRNILFGIAVLGTASLFLIKFIIFAFSASGPGLPHLLFANIAETIKSILRFLARLVSHSTAVNAPYVIVASMGAAIMLALRLFVGWKHLGSVAKGIFLTLTTSISIVIFVRFFVTSFNVTTPTYNSWMLPWIFLLFGSVFVNTGKIVRYFSAALVVVLLVCNFYSSAKLVQYGRYFAHGVNNQIVRLIDRYRPGEVSIVYSGGSEDSAHFAIYAPIRYLYGDAVKQYIAGDGNSTIKTIFDNMPSGDMLSLKSKYVFVIVSKPLTSKEIEYYLRRNKLPEGFRHDAARDFGNSGKWKLMDREQFISFYAADIDIFERI